MDKLVQIAQLLITFASSIYIAIVVIRFILQWVRADFYNPLSQFIVKATNPLLLPLRKFIPGFFGIDFASVVLALVLQMITVEVLQWLLTGELAPFVAVLLYSIQELLNLVLNIYLFSLLIMVIVSWIAPGSNNPALSLISSITEPVLAPIRRVIPSMGGLDFSVMLAILLIYILKILLS